MKKNRSKKIKIIIIAILLLLSTGCTKSLVDSETNKSVKNPVTGQNLTQNILCRPEDKNTIKIYNKYKKKIDISKLPSCNGYSVTDGSYDGLWDSIFVKPLAWVIINIGRFVSSYGLALIITSLIIRLIALPITKKTAIQSELIAKAKPELDRIEKKYENKTDQEAIMKKSQEITRVYQKYQINPFSSCLFAFIQLPLFIAFLEAINRVPAIFEEEFLGFQLGTTPITAFSNGNYLYLILILLVGITTYFSFKLNSATVQNDQTQQMNRMMVGIIVVMSLFMSSALDIYWLTTNLFTVVQNLMIKRSKEVNGKV